MEQPTPDFVMNSSSLLKSVPQLELAGLRKFKMSGSASGGSYICPIRVPTFYRVCYESPIFQTGGIFANENQPAIICPKDTCNEWLGVMHEKVMAQLYPKLLTQIGEYAKTAPIPDYMKSMVKDGESAMAEHVKDIWREKDVAFLKVNPQAILYRKQMHSVSMEGFPVVSFSNDKSVVKRGQYKIRHALRFLFLSDGKVQLSGNVDQLYFMPEFYACPLEPVMSDPFFMPTMNTSFMDAITPLPMQPAIDAVPDVPTTAEPPAAAKKPRKSKSAKKLAAEAADMLTEADLDAILN